MKAPLSAFSPAFSCDHRDYGRDYLSSPLVRPSPLALSLCLFLLVDALHLMALLFVYPGTREGGKKKRLGPINNSEHLEVESHVNV